MENTKNNSYMKLIPVMLCFFAMGFVDLVGIASNYVKADLGLTDSQANIFPSLVFFWFLIFSVPTGMLMNRIGRKKTVLLSLLITFASLLLPVFGDSYLLMLVSFSLLGIGNALMQTSLNPLLSNIVSGERLASTLTFGQFVKAIASFLAPYIAMWGATQAIPTFDLGWRVLFPIYMVVAVAAILMLNATQITEEPEEGKPSTFGQCLALLGKPFILLSFLGIMCHVGIDVGTNTTAPKILMERLGMTLADAGFATSLYFIFRTAGCFLGAFVLQKMAAKTFFAISVLCMLAAKVVYFPGSDDDLRLYRPDRVWKFQCISYHLLAGITLYAGQEERGFRTDDYGTFRRNHLPAGNGSGFGCSGTERSRGRDDGRGTLSDVLYIENQKVIYLITIMKR